MDKLPLDLRLLLFVPHRWILLPCSGGKGLYWPEAVGVALWLCRGVISSEAGGGCSYLAGKTFSGFDQLFPWYRQFRFHLLVEKGVWSKTANQICFGDTSSAIRSSVSTDALLASTQYVLPVANNYGCTDPSSQISIGTDADINKWISISHDLTYLYSN